MSEEQYGKRMQFFMAKSVDELLEYRRTLKEKYHNTRRDWQRVNTAIKNKMQAEITQTRRDRDNYLRCPLCKAQPGKNQPHVLEDVK